MISHLPSDNETICNKTVFTCNAIGKINEIFLAFRYDRTGFDRTGFLQLRRILFNFFFGICYIAFIKFVPVWI